MSKKADPFSHEFIEFIMLLMESPYIQAMPVEDFTLLLEKIVMYIVARDQRIWLHAFNLGKKEAGRESVG